MKKFMNIKNNLLCLIVAFATLLSFPMTAGAASASDSFNWQFDVHKYELDMPSYLQLVSYDGTVLSNPGRYTVGAFSGTECRGITDAWSDSVAILRIRGNKNNEKVNIVVIDNETGDIMQSRTPIIFRDGNIQGSPENPVAIQLGVLRSLTFIVNGVETTNTIYAGDPISAPMTTRLGYTFTGWQPALPDYMPNKDVTYTAQYSVNNYAFTFIVDGKSEVTSQTYGEKFKSPTPEKTGYTFLGWTPALPETVPAANKTYTAQFSQNKYLLTFADSEGKVIKSDSVLYGASYAAPQVSKPGHEFLGWSPSLPEEKVMPAEELVYVAQFSEPNQYVYKFLDKDGNLSDTLIVTYGTRVTVPEAPVLAHYTFTGWTPAVPEVVGESDMTFRASYTPHVYSVTFNGKDGAFLRTDSLAYNTVISSVPETELTGMTFTGWVPELNVGSTKVEGSIIYTAQYSANAHKVIYMVDGEVFTSTGAVYGTEIKPISAPVKEGFTFSGWKNDHTTMPDEDIFITGSFTRNDYKLTFISEGKEISQKTMAYEGEFTAPQTSKFGYTFAGWEPALPEDMKMPAKDMTYTAKFNVNTYNVTYKDYNGKVLDSVTVAYESKMPDVGIPQRTGYTFAGWNPDVPATMPAKDMTYVARYTVNKYNVTFVTNSDSTTSTLEYGTAINAPANPERTGFTFIGWEPAIDKTVPAYDVKYVAQFSGPNSFRFTFVTADGDTVKNMNVTYGKELTAPAAPVVTGHTFITWEPAVPETAPARNMTFTAKYSVNTHYVTFIDEDNNIIDRMEVNYGERIPVIDAPVIEGHTFVQWSPSLLPEQTMPDRDLVYSAVYSTNSHSVKYELDGKLYYSTALPYGSKVVTIANPSKEGYTFSGWKSDYTSMPDTAIVITGSFSKNKYSIAFYADDNTAIMDTTLYYGDPIKAPVAVKDGYTFIGWDNAVEKIMPANDLSYTAQFIVNTYALNYYIIEKNEQSTDTILYRTFKYASGETVSDTLPDLSIIGYDYTPWVRTTETVMTNADINVYCERVAHIHTVQFMADGKTVQKTTQNYGTYIFVPEDPDKEGYVFTGWSPSVPTLVPDTDVLFEALFTPKAFRINFVLPNGRLIESNEYLYGDKATLPDSIPALEGYHFAKWTPEFSETVTGDVTYSAVYDINHYTVSFVDDNDELLISFNMNYGSVIAVQPTAPEIEGKTFAGWTPEFIPGVTSVAAEDVTFKALYKTNPHTAKYVIDGKIFFERVLAEGEHITDIPVPAKEGYTFAGWENIPEAMPDEDIVIYGKFTPNMHKVTFIYGESEDERVVKEIAYGKPVNAPTPTKTGYTFVAWNLIVEPTMPDYDLEYVAAFAKNKYSVTFYDYDGATVLRKQTLAYGDEIDVPENPSRKGYEFRKWNLPVASTMPARNLTYVATYSVNLYNFTYIVDDEVYVSKEYVYGRDLTLVPELTKKGYDFSGWIYENPADGESRNIPEVMPDHNVVISGSFTHKNTFTYQNMLYSIVDYENRYAELVGFDDNAVASARARSGMNNAEEALIVPSVVYDENTNDSCIVFSIAAKAFEDVNIESITIPETVERIESSALNNEGLKSVSFEGTKIPELQTNAIPSTVQITLPNIEETKAEELISEAKDALLKANAEMLAIEEAATETDAEKVNTEYVVTATSNINGVVVEGVGTYKFGDVITLSAEPIEGYKMEWHIEAEVVEGDTYVCPETRSLAAELIYTPITYDVVYKINNEEIARKSYTYNTSLAEVQAPDAPAKDGYTFQGWSVHPDYMPANEVTIVGSYKINTYTVSFKIGNEIVTKKDYTYGSEIAQPEIEKAGYYVVWDTNAPALVPASDIVINGEYKAREYQITYMYDNQVVNTATVAYESEIPDYSYAPESTERYEYTFVSWKDAKGNVFDKTTMTIASDITLYAEVSVVDGIGAVIGTSEIVDVYSISGAKVAAQIPASELKSALAPGIYIINGMKVRISK